MDLNWNDILKDEVQKLVGRDLNENEINKLVFISSLPDDTRATLMRLLKDAYQNGLKK